MQYYVDTYSRVDMAPVRELRTTSDGIAGRRDSSTANITALTAPAWKAPEVFVAKGRDGKTDIWGVDLSGRRTSIRRRSIR